jgi:hypothetical protein
MSVIYKIYCKDENIKDSYVGSTNYYDKRKMNHKTACNNSNDKSYNFKVYDFIRVNGGFENFDFIILEQFETIINKNDLLKIEGQYIKNNNATLNCRVAGRTKKIYYENTKEQLLEKRKEKIICEFCKSLIRKYELKRHQQSKKCIECKNNIY